MMIFYTAAMLILALVGTVYLYIHLRQMAVNKCASLNEAMALHISEAVDNFCENVETDCSRVFKEKTVMSYDPVLEDYPGYENSRRKNEVKNKMLELAAGKSYNDFFIMFSDYSTVGKVSASADDYIATRVSAGKTHLLGDDNDTWVFAPDGVSRKIYYLRRVTDHSIMVLSCYVDELEPLIALSGLNRKSESSVILTDKSGRVIVSELSSENTGMPLSAEIAGMFTDVNETAVADGFIGTTAASRCGWRVFAISYDTMKLADSTMLTSGWLVIVFGVVLLSILIGLISTTGLTGADIDHQDSEYIDPISGRLNEYGLDEKISDRIETSLVGSTYAFIVIGIKDYETIKQTVSLAFRRSMVEKLVSISEGYFTERKFYIGRISGDRIVLFVDFSEFDLFKSHDKLKKECTAFGKEFEDFTVDESGALKLGVNVGVCIYPDHAEDYDSLLEKAEAACAEAELESGSCTVICADGGKDGKGK